MPKYLVAATVQITLEDVPVALDECPTEEADFEDALMQLLRDRLVLLDIKGGRTGNDGYIATMDAEQVDNWSSADQ